ncbi:nitroreductase family deazaflavin-dependent oxidoreductase [Asanoa sp. NPDC049573]|uniref:nitroreductase family deazaflavin-dependent oxidoreductase n=1 Tax=Asanoa sp. NPDC049573 TaxID=3155396 RepID=UPI00341FEAA1
MSKRTQAALNAVMRAVLATPLLHRAVSGRVLVIDVVGRRSGHRYRFPVGYVRGDGELLVGTGGRWRRNLRRGQRVEVTVARRRRTMTAEVVTDEKTAASLYRTILARNPVHGRYAQIRHDADGTPDRDDLRAALARGVAVVRLRPA